MCYFCIYINVQMKKHIHFHINSLFIYFYCSCFLISCNTFNNIASLHEQIDSLNLSAHKYRYVSIDSLMEKSRKAYQLSEHTYNDGKNAALCNLGFANYMKMDFHSSAECYRTVVSTSDNELLCLWADIGMMRLCSRTALNKEFYDYHNSALDRMERIGYDEILMDERQYELWNYLKSEFHLVASSYYMMLRQDAQVDEHLEWLKNDNFTNSDSTQLTNLSFLLGDYKHYPTDDENVRALIRSMSVGRKSNLTFYESVSMQAVAQMLIKSETIRSGTITFVREMLNVGEMKTMELALHLAHRALALAKEYGSLYDIAESYVVLSKYWLHNGDYQSSLNYSDSALAYVNFQHKAYCKEYGKHLNNAVSGKDSLLSYSDDTDSISTEMRWIKDDEVWTSPSLIADIREQTCKIYSAMGMKKEADYNRNIYLDILDGTRQDMKMQQRYETLANEEKVVDIMLFTVAFLLIVLFAFFYIIANRLKKKSVVTISKLNEVTELCRKIIISLEINEDSDEVDIRKRLSDKVNNDIKDLFPSLDKGFFSDINHCRMSRYDRELFEVIKCFYEWAVTNTFSFTQYEKEKQKLCNEKYLHEKRIEEHKRANITKSAGLSIATGITPFLDRVINEINKLKKGIEPAEFKDRLVYISELVDKINDYNTALSYWVKIKQGSVSLHIENFELNPLFQILLKSQNPLKNKGLVLEVHETNSVVKADKALTLFMIHTLLDNAQKYTNEGGKIIISALETDKYVEISVADTGVGMTPSHVKCIMDGKYHDAPDASKSNSSDVSKKGHGFGLMNCKGIIEKYKKLNSVFSVCGFYIESELGTGSKFAFRLPKGIMKSFYGLIAFPLLSLFFFACGFEYEESSDVSGDEWYPADSLLIKASDYADSLYFSNVDCLYEDALAFADSAFMLLNSYSLKENADTAYVLKKYDEQNNMPEIELWNSGFNTDYHVILDVRNELAITALALNDWKLYEYNNDIYTRLYKLVSQDKKLEEYCNALLHKNNDKQTLLVLIIAVIVIGALVCFILYYRHYLSYVFNMNQFVYFNGRMFDKSEYINADFLFDGINDIHIADSLSLAFMDGGMNKIIFQHSANSTNNDAVEEYMKSCIENKNIIVKSDGRIRVYPLLVTQDNKIETVGAMAVTFSNNSLSDDENLIMNLISQFVAIRLYYSSVETSKIKTELELLTDENRRVEQEENNIHIHNMVLDNCLSTIKHETIYYPSKIKVISDKIISTISNKTNLTDEEKADLKNSIVYMSELANYYKEIFTLFCNHALRQLQCIFFRKSEFNSEYLLRYAVKSFNKQNTHKRLSDINFVIDNQNVKYSVIGDKKLMEYFIDSLLSAILELEEPGNIYMQCCEKEHFIEFSLTDTRRTFSYDYIQRMFHPDSMIYDVDTDKLIGYQYLICKQIIREHDEYGGRRGCRVYVENIDENNLGVKYVFTLNKG